MDSKKTNKVKVGRLIEKGDELLKKGKFKKALEKFKKALDLDPDRPELYDRLIDAHDKADIEWDEKDVADSVGWVMKRQELTNPSIKITHARLTPEWQEVTDKIKLLIAASSEGDEQKLIEAIRSHETDAIYPLIDTILQIKKGFLSSLKETDKKCTGKANE